jgi:hypothetical protein
MAAYVREAPHDGQDSLAAAIDALGVFILIEVGGSILFYAAQRVFIPPSK